MSCADDDMFPPHDRVAFDPCCAFHKCDEHYSTTESLDSRLSTPSTSSTPPLSVASIQSCTSKQLLSPLSSSAACEHSVVLLEHKEAIAHLQQDVFALRHVMESEVSRMMQEMKVSMAALEVRLLEACKKTAASSAPLTQAASITPTPSASQSAVVAAPAVLSPRETAASVRRSAWGGDFMDSECGDDFTASHPSQFEEKEQELINALMKETLAHDDNKHAAAALHKTAAEKDSKPTPAAATAVPATSAKSSSASATALSITSLTALINPSGLPLTEPQLINLACRILADHGSVPVGKMGSLLHKAANDHTLPALLKERYGGLKKFLQAQSKYFMLGDDHPYNPHVALVGQQQLPVLPAAATHTQASGGVAHATSSSSPSSASPLHLAMSDSRSFGTSHSHDIYASQSRGHVIGSGSTVEYGRLMDSDDRDSLFTSYHAAHRKAFPSGVHTPTTARGTPFSASSMSVPSYTSRLQEALQQAAAPAYSSPSDMHSLSQQMDSLLTDVVSLDCEMVGCGIDGSRSVLARASIVNYHGSTLYDCFVQPPDGEIVADYRTHVSGIRPGDLNSPRAIPFAKAQEEVEDLLKGRIVVAHSVVSDLQALRLAHPPQLIRDTAHFPQLCPERPRSLRALVVERLGWVDFQTGEHDSVEDARAVMQLYRSVEDEWEAVIKTELAAEEREKKALAAKSAANARHRALLLDQQQQQGYGGFGPSQLHKGSYLPSTSFSNGSGYVGSSGQSFGSRALMSGHSTHSTLWK